MIRKIIRIDKEKCNGCASFTASSSYAGASLSSKEMAPVGHSGRQSPSPSQKCSLTNSAFPLMMSMAPS